MTKNLKTVAFYLPQYHPIPENDQWWGKGFTEWTNVTKAKPLYKNHCQPYLPSELGFYDLRVPETRVEQALLAKEYGVDVFCYYHYWFGNGKRLLQRPLQDMLSSGRPDFPFMLCWANQTWSGVWHGLDDKTLIEQTYPGESDERMHFECLLPAFRDPRYLRINNKPVFMVYQPESLPHSRTFISRWKRWAIESGLDGLYFTAEHADPFWDSAKYGFDSFVNVPEIPRRKKRISWRKPWLKIKNRYLDFMGYPSRIDYRTLKNHVVPKDASPMAIPCVLPNWDNTPRSGSRGVVFENATPDLFEELLFRAFNRAPSQEGGERLVFIKSWNEWAEGNVLEPSMYHGRSYLEALRNAKQSFC